ncbi:MAG: hypothetical protein L0Z62_40350 [Gemmataceae bacterium]|nr:hypothetical protein [Gemmataceae bacterium]
MAALVQFDKEGTAEYQGLDAIFEYTNYDGACLDTNCGQAAAATLLTFHGKLPPQAERARAIMTAIEGRHPPDNLGGLFGTSRRRVVRICKAFGLPVKVISGEEALRRQLDQRSPVVVMLGVSGGRFLNFDLPGGHWMVAYGYDRDHVHLTNWGPMNWEEFRKGWKALVPRLIGMRLRGLVTVSNPPPPATGP